MTGFGSFDNSTCKKVLDLLELGDLRLGQVVIKRVAVVKLGVNNGSGDHSINQSINLLGNKGPKATYKSQVIVQDNVFNMYQIMHRHRKNSLQFT